MKDKPERVYFFYIGGENMYPEIGPGTRFFFFNELRESAKKNEEARNFLASAEAVVFGGPNLLDEKIQ